MSSALVVCASQLTQQRRRSNLFFPRCPSVRCPCRNRACVTDRLAVFPTPAPLVRMRARGIPPSCPGPPLGCVSPRCSAIVHVVVVAVRRRVRRRPGGCVTHTAAVASCHPAPHRAQLADYNSATQNGVRHTIRWFVDLVRPFVVVLHSCTPGATRCVCFSLCFGRFSPSGLLPNGGCNRAFPMCAETSVLEAPTLRYGCGWGARVAVSVCASESFRPLFPFHPLLG